MNGRFSPRVWGCTGFGAVSQLPWHVFPTRVGMYRFPLEEKASLNAFSPRVWGCTVYLSINPLDYLVFPTRVGMYRALYGKRADPYGFPHACGDVPSW